MNSLLNTKNQIRFVLTMALLLLMSCNSDNFPNKKYFECKINGVTFKSAKILFPLLYEAPPTSSFVVGNDFCYFNFFTDCNLMEQEGRTPTYNLSYNIYLNAPSLETGKKYIMEALPGSDYMITFEEKEIYHEKRVSNCFLVSANGWSNYCFGTGFVIFTKIDPDNNRVEGELEVKIPFPKDEQKNPDTLNLTGKFRSTLKSLQNNFDQ